MPVAAISPVSYDLVKDWMIWGSKVGKQRLRDKMIDSAMTAIHKAFQAAAAMGVTVCVAAGDDGATDGVADGRVHVDFPASGRHALACGGTSLLASGNTSARETVWNQLVNGHGATGGGISDSDIFPLPSWQYTLGVPPSVNHGHLGRGVPDVAG